MATNKKITIKKTQVQTDLEQPLLQSSTQSAGELAISMPSAFLN